MEKQYKPNGRAAQALASMRREDSLRDWNALFEAAQKANKTEFSQAFSQVTRYAAPKNKQKVDREALFTSVSGFLIMLTMSVTTFLWHASDASSRVMSADDHTMLLFLGGFLGFFAFLAWLYVLDTLTAPRHARKNESKPAIQKLVIPEPVTYTAVAQVSQTTGALQAQVYRSQPTLENGKLISKTEKAVLLNIADDASAVDMTTKWEALRLFLLEMEEKANAPYNRLLEEHGLDKAQRLETLTTLRTEAESVRDRKILNSSVADSLNKYTQELIQDAKEQEELTSTL